jgi:hypothetical protein
MQWTAYEFLDEEKQLLLKHVEYVNATMRWMKTPLCIGRMNALRNVVVRIRKHAAWRYRSGRATAVGLNLMGVRGEVVKSCEDPLGKAKKGQSDLMNGRLLIAQNERDRGLNGFGEVI